MNRKEHLDQEWVNLILQAKKMGISIEEVRTYLHKGYAMPPINPRIKATSL
ncbi:anti-repressor SinI family protein [Fictibacillus fluitans]|uniref:Anti-repressor SinI family protein n=1 Tax=Fictibacillus fluitans TaxID=3058422 RepID=A0ABT8I171_9BACL|nr:anti-repressor SinI family protein [Fictibacillus sp. NE201]MDN4526792.1 anti-repressor SinI family protein [Fictibacillus sp. NE201]